LQLAFAKKEPSGSFFCVHVRHQGALNKKIKEQLALFEQCFRMKNHLKFMNNKR